MRSDSVYKGSDAEVLASLSLNGITFSGTYTYHMFIKMVEENYLHDKVRQSTLWV